MSWESLIVLGEEFKEILRLESETQPAACPECGGLFQTGPNGELFCSFDGYIWRP